MTAAVPTKKISATPLVEARGLSCHFAPTGIFKRGRKVQAVTEIDIGDIAELARDYRALKKTLPGLAVVGGCCGTDHRHVEAICRAVL
jgi:S-methylmethionine-dependent homocysteine/selenocysteine methylase